jgi:mRNA interferase MazF
MSDLVRGRIYRVRLDHVDGDKYFVVVSNNARNRQLRSVLAVRLTTSKKPDIPSIVDIPSSEPLGGGRAVCDDIVELWDDEVQQDLGAFSRTTMQGIDAGLRAALQLS